MLKLDLAFRLVHEKRNGSIPRVTNDAELEALIPVWLQGDVLASEKMPLFFFIDT
jgi:hypothetical protein